MLFDEQRRNCHVVHWFLCHFLCGKVQMWFVVKFLWIFKYYVTMTSFWHHAPSSSASEQSCCGMFLVSLARHWVITCCTLVLCDSQIWNSIWYLMILSSRFKLPCDIDHFLASCCSMNHDKVAMLCNIADGTPETSALISIPIQWKFHDRNGALFRTLYHSVALQLRLWISHVDALYDLVLLSYDFFLSVPQWCHVVGFLLMYR